MDFLATISPVDFGDLVFSFAFNFCCQKLTEIIITRKALKGAQSSHSLRRKYCRQSTIQGGKQPHRLLAHLLRLAFLGTSIAQLLALQLHIIHVRVIGAPIPGPGPRIRDLDLGLESGSETRVLLVLQQQTSRNTYYCCCCFSALCFEAQGNRDGYSPMRHERYQRSSS